MENQKIVFILLGPSGVGKTSLAKDFCDLRLDAMYLSTGAELWKTGKLRPWTESDTNSIKQRCHEMIGNVFKKFARSTTHQILLLDCVKDLEDAEFITSQAEQHGVRIFRALYSVCDDAASLADWWKNRGAPVFRLQKSPSKYLCNWHEKFNIVLSYYARMNVLSKSPSPSDFSQFSCAENVVNVGKTVFPVVLPSPFFRFLVLESVLYKLVYDYLLSTLGLNSFEFSIPASVIQCRQDVAWVADPRRYHVALKTNGMRSVLLKVEGKCFLINQRHEMFSCDIDVPGIPNNTVFDGEFLPLSSFADNHEQEERLQPSVFVISDVLAKAGEITWTLPFSLRQRVLKQLNISRDVATTVDSAKTSAANRISYPGIYTGTPQQAVRTEKLEVRAVVKDSHPSSPAEVESCLSFSNNNVHPLFTGLVFTPEMPYTFGADAMSFVLQSEDSSESKDSVSPQWYHPNSQRYYDHGESQSSQERTQVLQRSVKHGYDALQLRTDLGMIHVQSEEHPESNVLHPALTYDFDELYSLVSKEVQSGQVKKQVDRLTNLEVFNSDSSSTNPVVQLCEWFVLHPESKTVVTMPFVQFFTEFDAKAELGSKPDTWTEATQNFGGSIGVAFRWNEEVKVVTKHGMDSNDARSAKNWIDLQCDASGFKQGYTYVFEIVLKDYMKILEYQFEGLILVSVTNADGYELPYDEMMRHVRCVGCLMAVPRLTGHFSDVYLYCAGGTPSTDDASLNVEEYGRLQGLSEEPRFTNATTSSSKVTFSSSGWTIQFRNSKRMKLVHRWWTKALGMAKLVHPQVIWLLIKYNKLDELIHYLPNYELDELSRMINALGRSFLQTVTRVSNPLIALSNVVQAPALNCNEDSSLEWSGKVLGPVTHSRVLGEEFVEILSFQFFDSLKVTQQASITAPDKKRDETLLKDDVFLRDRLNECSKSEIKVMFEKLKKQIAQLCEDKEFLRVMVLNSLGENASDEHGRYFCQKLREDVGVTMKICEQIAKTVLLLKDENSDSQPTSSEHVDEQESKSSCFLSLINLAQDLNTVCAALSRNEAFSDENRKLTKSLNISPFYTSQGQRNELRIPILNHLRPLSPAIAGYEPSSHFKAWAKHWETLNLCDEEEESKMLDSILADIHGLSSLLFRFYSDPALPDETLLSILQYLDGISLVNMSRVCRKFRGIIASEMALREKVTQARLQHKRSEMDGNICTLGSSEEFYSQDSYS